MDKTYIKIAAEEHAVEVCYKNTIGEIDEEVYRGCMEDFEAGVQWILKVQAEQESCVNYEK